MPSNRLQREIALVKDATTWNCEMININQWIIKFKGPSETAYQQGIFELIVDVPFEFPFKPPSIRFKTRICHVNIMLDILEDNGDLTRFKPGYICEHALSNIKDWRPQYTIAQCLRDTINLLKEPLDCPKCVSVEVGYKMELFLINYARDIYDEYHVDRDISLLICNYYQSRDKCQLIIMNHISDLYRDNRPKYNQLVKDYVARYAKKKNCNA